MFHKKSTGLNKGLVIVLDAHNDLSAISSIDSDSQGFTAAVTDNRSFPLIYVSGFQIKTGHTNMVPIKNYEAEKL